MCYWKTLFDCGPLNEVEQFYPLGLKERNGVTADLHFAFLSFFLFFFLFSFFFSKLWHSLYIIMRVRSGHENDIFYWEQMFWSSWWKLWLICSTHDSFFVLFCFCFVFLFCFVRGSVKYLEGASDFISDL